jgi:hypothetical protein
LFGHEHRNLVYERFCSAWKTHHKTEEDADAEVQITNTPALSQPMDTDDSDASMFTADNSSVQETVVPFIPFPYGQKTMLRISAPETVTPSPTDEWRWTDLEIDPNPRPMSATATHTYEQFELDSDPDNATMQSLEENTPVKSDPNEHYNETNCVYMASEGSSTQQYCGVPAIHRGTVAESPLNFWLVDSGATAHMTPFLTDLDPGSFKPTPSSIRSANQTYVSGVGVGNVTLTIKDAQKGECISWTLYNVLVVPDIPKRLISVEKLCRLKHEIRFRFDTITFILRSPNGMNTVVIVHMPFAWDPTSGKLIWPEQTFPLLQKGVVNHVLCCPSDLPALNNTPDLLQHTTSLAEADAPPPPVPTVSKRHVGADLMHNRLGHSHNSSILLAHQNNIWNDVAVKPDPESICETCQITLSRRTNRNHDRPPDYPTDPGRMVMTDIISNPFPSGLTSKSHFPYYLLIVDVVSHFPVLLGLRNIDSNTVFNAMREYRTNFQPNPNQDANPNFNISPFLHVRADAGSQFSSRKFITKCNNNNIKVLLAAPKHQEMNGLCERTWQSLRQLAFAFMNYARVREDFGDMSFEHAWKVFSVLPIKELSKANTLITPFEKHYRRKPSLRKFHVLFCPCVYKVYDCQKTITIKSRDSKEQRITHRFNSTNHPQRGVPGIYCGHPCGQAGYLIWNPRTKSFKVSADVTFYETFQSAGPRRHKSFDDALPTMLPTAIPKIGTFLNTVPEDDHYGPPLLEYHEDVPTDGFLQMTPNPSAPELFD